MLYDRVLAQHFRFVHFNHPLNKNTITPVTFSQEAAPLMLLRMGEDSANDTPFFTSIINLMEFIYMYSAAYLSIKLI